MVALVDLVGLLAAQGVGEGVVELLWGEAYGLVACWPGSSGWEDGPDLRDRETLMPSAGTESMATPAAP